MFVHAALHLIRSYEIFIKWGVLLKLWIFIFALFLFVFVVFKWFACQLFHSKVVWGRRPGCYITQEGCPALLPRKPGMLGRMEPLGKPLGRPIQSAGYSPGWCSAFPRLYALCSSPRYSPVSNALWSSPVHVCFTPRCTNTETRLVQSSPVSQEQCRDFSLSLIACEDIKLCLLQFSLSLLLGTLCMVTWAKGWIPPCLCLFRSQWFTQESKPLWGPPAI